MQSVVSLSSLHAHASKEKGDPGIHCRAGPPDIISFCRARNSNDRNSSVSLKEVVGRERTLLVFTRMHNLLFGEQDNLRKTVPSHV